ncbi:chemotaxis protein CheD [Brevundimonas sp. LM2]|uniref:chemotaxis protein CheD n=1 Tax=Brevundimonas sp. LM2 TaxID=1938605 RepID=UPI0009839622|nr:chemotaxis protein CheD [Brevundimonas sp. LM2]AQR63603.1 chemotaxis protein CheD [Brevundimonas sp. LM2]
MAARDLAPDEHRLHVGQGTFEVTDRHDVVLSTILGSCVSACLRDPSTGIGGMNHFLLPEAPGSGGDDRRYGVQAMELLINGLLRLGAQRDRLEAKVFGGARMSPGLMDIGGKNIAFIRRFLDHEDIPIVAECLGGEQARRIHFWPAMGRVKQQRVSDPSVIVRERVLARPAAPAAVGDLELFE